MSPPHAGPSDCAEARAIPDAASMPPRRPRARLIATLSAVWGAVVGLAPHVLHHVGPLVGTALVAGAGGTAIFGVVGLVATIPTLRRLHRRFGTWRAPALALVLFVALFLVSSFLVGPLISGGESPAEPTPSDHISHHD